MLVCVVSCETVPSVYQCRSSVRAGSKSTALTPETDALTWVHPGDLAQVIRVEGPQGDGVWILGRSLSLGSGPVVSCTWFVTRFAVPRAASRAVEACLEPLRITFAEEEDFPFLVRPLFRPQRRTVGAGVVTLWCSFRGSHRTRMIKPGSPRTTGRPSTV